MDYNRPHTDHLYPDLRRQQCALDPLGAVYTALYELHDRLRKTFYSDSPDDQDMPEAIIRFGPLKRNRMAEYTRFDGTLWTVITIDPLKHRTAADAAEYLAHEMVHLWMDYLGYEQSDNYHGKPFHDAMANYGICTSGRYGEHVGYIGDVWKQWMEENHDLGLGWFVLSDEPQVNRRLMKWQCPTCGFSFRSRRTDLIVRCQHQLEDDELQGAVGSRMEMV